MNPSNPLDSVYFIQLPEDFKLSNHALQIDPTIPLPVQKKDKDAPGTFDIKELTQEQILSGILTVLAYNTRSNKIPIATLGWKTPLEMREELVKPKPTMFIGAAELRQNLLTVL